MTKTICTLFFISVFYIHSCYSQQINTAKLDSLFDVVAANNLAMGSIVISKNNNIVYRRPVGYSNFKGKKKIPNTQETKFRIASISKMFTATLIFQLIEDGKMTLNTPLDQFFPQLPNAKTITIRELLNHHSGLHNFINDTSWKLPPKTEDEMLKMIADAGTDFEPGAKADYSNSNYLVLAYIIEKIYGKPYSKVLQEKIVRKAGLENTYYGGKIDTKNDESHSYQYYTGNWHQYPETDMSLLGGAGGILSTPADMAKFIEALFSNRLVNENSLNEMETITDGYGMGLIEIPYGYKTGYGYSGNIDAFFSVLTYYPEDSLAVAMCANGLFYPINDILIDVLRTCFNKPYSIPSFKTVVITTNDLDKYLGVYSNDVFHMKMTITKDNTTLVAQATGQTAFSLQAVGKDRFINTFQGIELDFKVAAGEMILKQIGRNFIFTKE